jgi:hypothetical protein
MSTELAAPAVAADTALVGSLDHVTLSETDRSRLQTFVHVGHESARSRIRAQVLFKVGDGWSFAEGGVDAVLSEQRQERFRQALTGSQQAHLIAVACSPVPQGMTTRHCACWRAKPSSWASSRRSRPRPSERA